MHGSRVPVKRSFVSLLRRVAMMPYALVFVMLTSLVFPTGGAVADGGSPLLDIEEMTFVAAQGGENQVRVRADSARFDTARDVATLSGVRTTVSGSAEQVVFEMTCEESELDLATNDFIARGRVVGRTNKGVEFEVDWLRYDHAKGQLYTDAPVVITESFGTYRGGGFRYDVQERRFRLHSGASMVQNE